MRIMATSKIRLTETLHTATYTPVPPKPPVKKKKYFNNLDEFLAEYSFKVTALPWRYENDHYIISQVTDEDSYGFAIYSITCKRYFDDSSFRGRLPNSKFAGEILMAIAEDYTLEDLNSPPQDYPDKRDDVFLSDLAIQTDLRKNKNIHISIEYITTSEEEKYYVYQILYFPKAKQFEKELLDRQVIITSYFDPSSNAGKVFNTYEEALHEAVKKVYSNIIHI